MPALFPSRGFRRTRERASGLLFAFGVDDLSTTLTTGQTLALTRASGRTVVDATGRVTHLAHSQWPWSAVYNSAGAVWEPTLDVGGAATNVCLQSENLGTTWSAVGTPTRTAAALRCGDVVLDLVGDDTAASVEGYSQTISFTGNAPKAISLYVREGTSTSTVVRLQDSTATTNRLLGAITWSAGVPSVTMTTGTYLGATLGASGVYRLQFQTTSVTAANTNILHLYPATTAALAVANTGTVYLGGVQVENKDTCSAYVKTTTTSASASADVVTSTIGFDPPDDLTVYLRLSRQSWANSTITLASYPYVLYLGTAPGALGLQYVDSKTLVATCFDGASTSLQVSGTIPSPLMYDVALQLTNLWTAPQIAIDVGSGYGTPSSAGTAFTTWGGTTLRLGNGPGGGNQLDAGIRRCVIAAGARTLAEMRGLAV